MLSDKSDIDIIKGIREGKVSAFRDLYARYSNLIYRNILVRVKSSFDADDIFQDFFIQVWEKRETIEITSSVKNYLLVWLRNHILNSIKKEQIRDRYHEISQEGVSEVDDYTWVRIVASDLDDQIKDLVRKFPPRLRDVYLLSREQHLSVKEIAERLSVSEQTVKNQLTDILKRLRKEINRKNFCLVLPYSTKCPISKRE